MYIVDGFVFEDEETANLAKKEEEGIRFIKERTALNNPEVVLKLYNKLLEQELFVTPVGHRFLVELQNILYGSTYIAKKDVPPIKVKNSMKIEAEPDEAAQKAAKKKEKQSEGVYQKRFRIALFFAIVFGLSVIGMFAITEVSKNNVNIINYREKIVDEYSAWEAQLQEKEAELKAWEQELEAKETGQ